MSNITDVPRLKYDTRLSHERIARAAACIEDIDYAHPRELSKNTAKLERWFVRQGMGA